MTSPPITAAEVESVLGEIDPIAVERILESGASFDEVAEALSAVEDEDVSGEVPHEPSSPRVFAVRRILEELVLDEADDDHALASAPI